MRPPAALLLVLLGSAACGEPCRDVETRSLDFSCDVTRGFSGQLHFDSASTFETFLAQQCLPRGDDERAHALVESVDFSREAVFVAVGPHSLDPERCLAARRLSGCQVCESGLKVLFEDRFRDPGAGCPSTRWTVAFALKREDLRAALDAAEGVDGSAPSTRVGLAGGS